MWTFSFCSNARSFDRPTVAKSGEKIKVPIFIRRKGADAFRPALAAGGSLMAYPAVSPEAKGCADDLYQTILAFFHGDSSEFRSCPFRSGASINGRLNRC